MKPVSAFKTRASPKDSLTEVRVATMMRGTSVGRRRRRRCLRSCAQAGNGRNFSGYSTRSDPAKLL
jgi:hypothetical protein